MADGLTKAWAGDVRRCDQLRSTRAIDIRPVVTPSPIKNRGMAYARLGEGELAIKDFDLADQLRAL